MFRAHSKDKYSICDVEDLEPWSLRALHAGLIGLPLHTGCCGLRVSVVSGASLPCS